MLSVTLAYRAALWHADPLMYSRTDLSPMSLRHKDVIEFGRSGKTGDTMTAQELLNEMTARLMMKKKTKSSKKRGRDQSAASIRDNDAEARSQVAASMPMWVKEQAIEQDSRRVHTFTIYNPMRETLIAHYHFVIQRVRVTYSNPAAFLPVSGHMLLSDLPAWPTCGVCGRMFDLTPGQSAGSNHQPCLHKGRAMSCRRCAAPPGSVPKNDGDDGDDNGEEMDSDDEMHNAEADSALPLTNTIFIDLYRACCYEPSFRPDSMYEIYKLSNSRNVYVDGTPMAHDTWLELDDRSVISFQQPTSNIQAASKAFDEARSRQQLRRDNHRTRARTNAGKMRATLFTMLTQKGLSVRDIRNFVKGDRRWMKGRKLALLQDVHREFVDSPDYYVVPLFDVASQLIFPIMPDLVWDDSDANIQFVFNLDASDVRPIDKMLSDRDLCHVRTRAQGYEQTLVPARQGGARQPRHDQDVAMQDGASADEETSEPSAKVQRVTAARVRKPSAKTWYVSEERNGVRDRLQVEQDAANPGPSRRVLLRVADLECGRTWNNMTDVQRAPYVRRFLADKAAKDASAVSADSPASAVASASSSTAVSTSASSSAAVSAGASSSAAVFASASSSAAVFASASSSAAASASASIPAAVSAPASSPMDASDVAPKTGVSVLMQMVRDNMFCAICQNMLVMPQILRCGHTFCLDCVVGLFKETLTCCICKTPHTDWRVHALPLDNLVRDAVRRLGTPEEKAHLAERLVEAKLVASTIPPMMAIAPSAASSPYARAREENRLAREDARQADDARMAAEYGDENGSSSSAPISVIDDDDEDYNDVSNGGYNGGDYDGGGGGDIDHDDDGADASREASDLHDAVRASLDDSGAVRHAILLSAPRGSVSVSVLSVEQAPIRCSTCAEPLDIGDVFISKDAERHHAGCFFSHGNALNGTRLLGYDLLSRSHKTKVLAELAGEDYRTVRADFD